MKKYVSVDGGKAETGEKHGRPGYVWSKYIFCILPGHQMHIAI